MRKLILAVIVLFLLTNCGAYISKKMASWEGHHYGELIAAWGPPDQVFDDGFGGSIFVYTKVREWTTPGKATTKTNSSTRRYWDDYYVGSATSRTTYTPATTHTWKAYRMFWVNEDGIIYRWKWKGL